MSRARSSYPAPSSFLREALLVDAAGCAIFALGALVLLAGPVDLREHGVYPPLLAAVGLLALVGVARFPRLARRKRVSPMAIGIIIATNAAWAVACLSVVAFGWIDPSPTGGVVVVAQALGTGFIALLEWIGLQSTLATAKS